MRCHTHGLPGVADKRLHLDKKANARLTKPWLSSKGSNHLRMIIEDPFRERKHTGTPRPNRKRDERGRYVAT